MVDERSRHEPTEDAAGDDDRTGTQTLTEEELRAASVDAALPFINPPPDDDEMPGTLTLSEDDQLALAAAPVAPFFIAPAKDRDSSSPDSAIDRPPADSAIDRPPADSAEIPGAPWANEPSAGVSSGEDRTYTADLPKAGSRAPRIVAHTRASGQVANASRQLMTSRMAATKAMALRDYAAIKTEISTNKTPLAQILERRRIEEAVWFRADRAWTEAIALEAEHGRSDLSNALASALRAADQGR